MLNTVVALAPTPFPGEVLARFSRKVGGVMTSATLWRQMMRRVGILDHAAVPPAEIDAYRDLALREDQGAAYLKIMRGLHAHREAARTYSAALDVTRVPYPVQIVWGANDPILSLKRYGWAALRMTGLPALAALPARHFLQEDQAPAVAALVARLAADAA